MEQPKKSKALSQDDIIKKLQTASKEGGPSGSPLDVSVTGTSASKEKFTKANQEGSVTDRINALRTLEPENDAIAELEAIRLKNEAEAAFKTGLKTNLNKLGEVENSIKKLKADPLNYEGVKAPGIGEDPGNSTAALANPYRLKTEAQEQINQLESQKYALASDDNSRMGLDEFVKEKKKLYDKYAFKSAKTDTGFLENPLAWASEGIQNMTAKAVNTVYSPEAQMSAEEKVKYDTLTQKINTIARPLVAQKMQLLERKQAELDVYAGALREEANGFNIGTDENNYKFVNPFSNKELMKAESAKRMIDKALTEANNYINGAGAFEALNPALLETFALQDWKDVLDNLTIVKPVVDKYNEGQQLTEGEQHIIDALGVSQDIMKDVSDKQNYGYNTVKGLQGSLEFMRDIYFAGTLTKGATAVIEETGEAVAKDAATSVLKKTASRRLANVAAGVAKVPIALEKMALQTAAMPGQVGKSFWNNYLGDTVTEYDEEGNPTVYVRDGVCNHFKKKFKQIKVIHNARRKELLDKGQLNAQEQKELDEIEVDLGIQSSYLQDSLDEKLEKMKPMSSLEALVSGFGDTMAENISEIYTGHALGAIGKGISKVTPKGLTSAIGKVADKLANTKLGRYYSNLTKAKKRVSDAVFGQDVIGGFGEEFAEEFTVAPITAAMHGNMDEIHNLYSQVNPETGKREMSFRPALDIAAQTFLMTAALGAGANVAMRTRAVFDGDLKNSLKERKTTRKDIDRLLSATTDQDVHDVLSLMTAQSGFSMSDTQLKVKELRAKNKNKEADALEKTMFHNLVGRAISSGVENELSAALNKVVAQKGIGDATKMSVLQAKENLDKLIEVNAKYAQHENRGEIVNLAFEKMLNKQSTDQIQTEMATMLPLIDEELRNVVPDLGLTLTELMSDKETLSEEQQAKFMMSSSKADTVMNIIEPYLHLNQIKNELAENMPKVMKRFNEAVKPSQQTINEKAFRKAFANRLEAIEKSEEENPSATFNYNNKLQISPELITSLVEDMSKEWIGKSEDGKLSKAHFDAIKEGMLGMFQQVNAKKLFEEAVSLNKEHEEQRKGKEDVTTEEQVLSTEEEAPKIEVARQDNLFGTEEPTPVSQAAADFEGFLAANDPTASMPDFGDPDAGMQEVMPGEDWNSLMPSAARPMSDEERKALKLHFNKLYKAVEDTIGRKPSFQEVLAYMIKHSSKETVEKNFEIFKMGWELNGLEETNFKDVYNAIFDPYKELRDSFLSFADSLTEETPAVDNTTVEEVAEDSQSQLTQIEAGETTPTAFDEENVPIKAVQGNRIQQVENKLAFNAIKYDENIDADGTLTREASMTGVLNLGENSVVDFRDLLNPDMYNKGSQLHVVVAPEHLWSTIKINVGRDAQGKSVLRSFSEIVQENETSNPNYRNSKEFMDIVPILAVDAEGKPVSYIHDVNWYNPYNVADPTGSPVNPAAVNKAHWEHIQRGKDNVSTLRQKIVQEGLNTITISEKREGAFYTIANKTDEQGNLLPLMTITEANPQSEIGVQIKRGSIEIKPGVTFENDKRVVLNREQVRDQGIPGETWHLRRIGTDEQGRETWRAFKVLRKVSPEQMETLRWAWAAYAKLNKDTDAKGVNIIQEVYNKAAGKSSYALTTEQAEKIVADIKALTGYDITRWREANAFLRQYAVPRSISGKDSLSVYGNMLYLEKFQNDWAQHTAMEGLDKNANMVHIKDGVVSSLGKSYTEYLKDTLMTDVKSFNVGTEEKPVYATSIQPVILFEYDQETATTANTPEVRLEERNEELAEVQEEIKDVAPAVTKGELTQEQVNVLDKFNALKSTLGFNFNNFSAQPGIDVLRNNKGDKITLYHYSSNGLNPLENFDIKKGLLYTTLSRGSYSDYGPEYSFNINSKATIKNLSEFHGKYGIDLDRHDMHSHGLQPYHFSVEEIDSIIAEGTDILIDDWGEYIILNPLSIVNQNQSFSAQPVSLVGTDILKNIFNITPGLNISQEGHIVDFVYNYISSSIDIKYKAKVNKETLLNELKNSYNEIVGPARVAVEQFYTTLSQMDANIPKVAIAISEAKQILDIMDNIKANWSKEDVKATLEKSGIPYSGQLSIIDKAMEEVSKTSDIKEEAPLNDEQEQAEEDLSMRVKSFEDNASLTESGKQKTTYRLRRFMAGIQRKNPDGSVKKGFLGLPEYVGFNEVYDTIYQMLGTGVYIQSDYATMKAKIAEMANAHPWINEFVEKLDKADEQIKNEFVYNYRKHAVAMKFAMYSKGNGGIKLKVYDTNANEVVRTIIDTWSNNFITSPLVSVQDGEYAIDKTVAQNLLDQYNNWSKDRKEIPQTEVREWLSNFGIKLSDGYWNELVTAGFSYKGNTIEYRDLFTDNDTPIGLLSIYLKKIVKQDNTAFEENEKNHPYGDMGGVLKALAKGQSRFAAKTLSKSFRDAGKNISGITAPTYLTNRIDDLKRSVLDPNSSTLMQDLMELSISQDSLLLELLRDEPDFASKLEVNYLGLTAFKQLGKKASNFASITDLNTKDHDVTKLTMFQDTQQGTVAKKVNGISMRIARMFMPTMSDKTQMLMMSTGVLNLMEDSDVAFSTNDQGQVIFNENLRELLYQRLVLPELKRIINFHAKVKSTDIKDYDLGAQIFNFIPALNNIKDENGVRMIKRLAVVENITVEEVEGMFKTAMMDVVENLTHSLVEKKKKVWDNFKKENAEGNITELPFFDAQYLAKGKGNLNDKFETAAYDFVINSMLTNADMFTVIAGDPAMYSQSKNFKGNIPGDIVDDNMFYQIAKKNGVNIGKRLALLIAPGATLAGSHHQQYRQVFLEDSVDITSNADYLISLFYGKEFLDKKLGEKTVSEILTDYPTASGTTQKMYRSMLQAEFPSIADYFDIESTDAQEYTTVQEHLMILESQGRLSAEQRKQIGDKLIEEKPLTKEERGLVLQPIKPVYTGHIVDKQQDVSRVMYIKSSSWPLIPQVTAGNKLNNLRLALEKLEKEQGLPVRASYQTANKVGAMKNPINPFNPESLAHIEQASLVLNRNDFRIQQDVPFKSDSKKEDKVAMNTQFFKILFGDGMLNESGFEVDGQKLTGKELYAYYQDAFNSLMGAKKAKLFDELGLDADGNIVDQQATLNKLQDLLQKEAVKRGYLIQDIRGLELQEIPSQTGGTYKDFRIPLWLSVNSNRYESLLNSIITNRLMKFKLPGNAFVTGSESGFGFQEDLKGIDASRIIYLDGWNGKELQGVQMKSNIKKVILPIGTSGSGKSTWIKTLSKNDYEIISPDNMRVEFTGDMNDKSKDKEIYEAVKRRAEQAIKSGKQVVIDSTNLQKDRRRDFINYIQSVIPNTKIEYKLLPLNPELAKQRIKNDINNGVNRANVPDETIDRHAVLYKQMLEDIKEEPISEFVEEIEEKTVFSKAQELVPSKFKTPDGKLLDLFQKKDGQYMYIQKRENGTWGLKTEMFDQELLNDFSSRIPTSSHVSGSILEIVGFLPPEVADLMIVPKNFTKQKGLDYDIDKETAYKLNHVVNYKTGRVEVLSEKHKEEGLKKLSKLIEKEKEVKDSKRMSAALEDFYNMLTVHLDEELMDEMRNFGSDYEKQYNTIAQKYDEKLAENKFIKTHIAIFSNPNPNVQRKINKVLSMEFAQSQANMIEELTEEAEKNAGIREIVTEEGATLMEASQAVDTNSSFTILSDEYQKQKMGLGAAGKMAIGVYSNYVTFHALTQQVEKPLRLMMPGVDGPVTKNVRIGDMVSQGVIGREMTLDGERSIAEAFAEKQNTATDNEKEQILGRVNVNSYTIGVDSLLTLLGFDKDSQGNSVSYTLLSQPVIKEFVEMMSNGKGITAEFNGNLEASVIDKLVQKYGGKDFIYSAIENRIISVKEEGSYPSSKLLTGDNLIQGIRFNGENKDVQLAALDKFLDLKAYAENMAKVQKVVNTNNLGKSIIESNQLYYDLAEFGKNDKVANVSGLIGLTYSGDGVPTEPGYINVRGAYVKPTTPQGNIVLSGVPLAEKLWKNFFPYGDYNFRTLIDQILSNSSVDLSSPYKVLEAKQEIVEEIKKYIYSRRGNGIFDKPASQERKRLFFDSPTNMSLANYLNTYEDLQLLKENRLLSKFTYELNTNGKPSIVRFNNTISDNFDEKYLYNSFAEMIIEDKQLPDWNGEPMTTRKLAQELITYAYVEGGVQEAIQFIKYVPIEYLSEVGVTSNGVFNPTNRIFQLMNAQRNPDVFKQVLDIQNEAEVGLFFRQYMQHNPDKAVTLDPKDKMVTAKQFTKKRITTYNKSTRKEEVKEVSRISSFVYALEVDGPKFFVIKNSGKNKQGKFDLYENKGMNKYVRISTLGEFGMNEYEYGNPNAVSLLETEVPETAPVGPKGGLPAASSDVFELSSTDNVVTAVEKIANNTSDKFFRLSEVARMLLPMLDPTTKLMVADTTEIVGGKGAAGIYQKEDNTIILDPRHTFGISDAQAAKTLLHEVVHSITERELRKYYSEDGKSILPGAPAWVSSLHSVFSAFRSTLGQDVLDKMDRKLALLKARKPVEFTQEEINYQYGAVNIFEFVTTALTGREFQQRMSEVPYMQSGKSLWDKFKEAIINILTSINPDAKKDSIAEAAILETLNFILEERKVAKNSDTFAQELPAPDEYDTQDFPDIDPDADTGPADVSLQPIANPFDC